MASTTSVLRALTFALFGILACHAANEAGRSRLGRRLMQGTTVIDLASILAAAGQLNNNAPPPPPPMFSTGPPPPPPLFDNSPPPPPLFDNNSPPPPLFDNNSPPPPLFDNNSPPPPLFFNSPPPPLVIPKSPPPPRTPVGNLDSGYTTPTPGPSSIVPAPAGKPVCYSAWQGDANAYAQPNNDYVLGVEQYDGKFNQWVRFYHITSGDWVALGNSMYRMMVPEGHWATKFVVESPEGKVGQIVFGDKIRLRILDGTNRYVRVGSDGLMYVDSMNPSDPATQFVVQVKHNYCTGGCTGRNIADAESFGHKLISVGNGKVCGADSNCQLSCKEWDGTRFMLTMTS